MPWSRRSLALCVGAMMMSLAFGACDGRISEGPPSIPDPDLPPETPPSTTAGPPAFESSRESITLLPFDVRLQRVADAAGVATDDAILADLRAARLDLGAHDYAAGIPPDLTWSARRMSGWARALRPVCQSTEFQTLYPNLRDSLEDFTLAAYGRRATPEDYEAYDMAVAGAELSEEATYRAVCIALLSSTELVAR